MAINSYDVISCNKKLPIPECSTNISRRGNLLSQLDYVNSGTNWSVRSINSRLVKSYKSPYLAGGKTLPTSRIVDKKIIQKRNADIVSSSPLAVNIYKANSDELKSIKWNRKVKKSVLTLPNEQIIIPDRCTISDVNDSDYFNNEHDCSHKFTSKKRTPYQSIKKFRNQKTDPEFDARYCPHRKIELDSSSTDVTRHFDGDRKRVSHIMKSRKSAAENPFNCHNIWQVLRNINRFQLRPSPPASNDTIITPRKKKAPKRYKRKNKRFIGTCHTEEFAYISSIEVDSKSARSFSQSSGFDRITVIDKNDDFNFYENIEKTVANTNNVTKNVIVKNSNRAKNTTPFKFVAKLNNKLKKFKDRQIKSIDSTASDKIYKTHFEAKNCKGNDTVSDENKIGNPHELHHNFIYSGNSGSSKAAYDNFKGNENSSKLSSDESNRHIKGITKIEFSKDRDIRLRNKTKSQKSKLRLFTTIPSTTIIPKLTQTDIKRRLAKIKFPLVILDKDQVSSTIQVADFDDHPQFAGLDKHVWPFMLEWNRDLFKNDKSFKMIENRLPKTKRYVVQAENNYKDLSKNNKIVINNLNTKEKRNINSNSLFNCTVTEDQSVPKIERSPIHNINDNILKLLYKKSPTTNSYELSHQVGGGDVKNIKFKNSSSKNNIGSNQNLIHISTTKEPSKLPHRSPIKPVIMKTKLSSMNTSKITPTNLIETITMNIKNGIYYNEDHKLVQNKQVWTSKENSIQTTAPLKDILEIQTDQVECIESSTSTEISTKYQSLLQDIPGFDYALPEIEIKTLNFNKIEVKHCLLNILVQFDVMILPLKPKIHLKRSYSLTPLEVIDGETKIFKCKTSVLNAILPAELCGILPKMIRDLTTPEVKTLPLLPVNDSKSHFSTISELTRFENTKCIMSQLNTPAHLDSFLDEFLCKTIKTNFKSITKLKWAEQIRDFNFLNPPIINKLFISSDLAPREDFYVNEAKFIKSFYRCGIGEILNQKPTLCTALQSYNLKNWRAATTFKPYNLHDMISKIWKCNNCLTIFMAPIISLITFGSSQNGINVYITLNKDNQEVFVGLNELKTNSMNGNFSNLLSKKIDSSSGKITCIDEVPICQKASIRQVKRSTPKLNRKSYVKLYKKCKSTTHIHSEKHITSLNKIENLDDFFQLLGWRKSLSSVIDDHKSLKVMSSVAEMKNWVSEINCHQALLTLLLVNKKDTPNLVRFKPVLLQGIAVNRITKVSELDMEIEVIERENLNSSLKFEGISYLPASIENKDNLLEELFWIAKTTASDYQKPFDESSEKLLKSLLERRKKLNPSYLRLMARYVGLGLLKTPCKEIKL